MIRPGIHIKILRWLSGLVLLLFSACVTEDIEPDFPLLVAGDPLPQFVADLNDGRQISTSSFEGKAGMIIFFNTSCPDCQRELPIVQRVFDQFKDNPDVLIVAIAREENRKSISEYWQRNGLSIPYSAQEGREIYNLFAKNSIPRIFISNADLILTACFDDQNMPDFDILYNVIESTID